MSNARRRCLLGAVVAVVVAVGLWHWPASSPASARTPAAALLASAVATGPAQTEAWYCVSGAPGPVVLSSESTRTVDAHVTFASGPGIRAGSTAEREVSAGKQVVVAAPIATPRAAGTSDHPKTKSGRKERSSATQSQRSTGTAGFAPAEAATVVLDGSGVGATMDVGNAAGWSSVPCASETSTSWYFPNGSSAIGATLRLDIYNPAATPAVADVSLVTALGTVQPVAVQDVSVSPGQVVSLRLGALDAGQTLLASEVTATHGSVVAAELETVRLGERTGASEQLGAVAPDRRWVFAQSDDLGGATVGFDVLNPAPTAQTVTAVFSWQGAGAQPVTFQVPADSVNVLDAEAQLRIPPGTPYSTVLTSAGSGIVAGRSVLAKRTVTPRSSALGGSIGMPSGARSFLVPALAGAGKGVFSFAVVTATGAPAVVSVSALGPGGLRTLPGLSHRSVSATSPLEVGFRGSPFIGDEPVVVTSSAPVAVELDPYPVGYPGAVVVSALPEG